MNFLIFPTLVAIYLVYWSCNSEIARLRVALKHQDDQLNELIANSCSEDVGNIWDVISEMQPEIDQLKSGFSKYNDSLVEYEKSLHEIDDLLGDVATKCEVKEHMQPISVLVDQIHDSFGHITRDISERLDNIESILSLHKDQLYSLQSEEKKSIKKPQSKKTGAKVAKKSAEKLV